jgi:hypothetical protein
MAWFAVSSSRKVPVYLSSHVRMFASTVSQPLDPYKKNSKFTKEFVVWDN